MTYSAHKNTALSCSATISRKRNRIKSYGDSSLPAFQYHLKDGEEFEIELFNPLPHQVLAKIHINGKLISNAGMVLMPGQRIFLERFIDTNEKFIFKTYVVEDTAESKGAIIKNGDIKVEFYNEDLTPSYNNYSWNGIVNSINLGNYNTYGPTTYIPNTFTGNPTFTNVGSTAGGINLSSGNINFSGNTNLNTSSIVNTSNSATTITLDPGATLTFTNNTPNTSYYSSAGGTSTMDSLSDSSTTVSNTIETGRIAGGTASSQTFETVYGKFNYFPSKTVNIKLLPESLKPVEASEIRNYCSGCGTRVKKSSWKFCPSCGEKY